MKQDEIMLKVENVSKVYRLGEIGGTTLRDELQRAWAKIRHKEDPTKKIGTKNYNKGEKFKALDNISFEVKKGERIGIIGHNGAGKSTLLKLISRVTGPTEGKIHLNGRVASMLEVGTGFHPELTGRENVYMNGAILGMTKKEIDAKMEDIIEFSEVRQFIDTPVKRYSSGMYVKLAFSVAAHLDSEIMIMDEVLAVGDMAFQNKCLTKMKEVSQNENKTILYVSHNMGTIRELCDKVIVLREGKIIYCGDVETGISIYLNKKSEACSLFNLVNQHRHSVVTRKIQTKTVKFEQNSKNVFKANEDVRFKINYYSASNFTELKLRTVIKTSTNVAVASSLINIPKIISDCDYELNVSIEKNFLAPGSYILNFEFVEFDSSFNVIYHDQIINCVFFEINNYDDRKWYSQFWGSVSSIPITIQLEKENE